MTGRRAGRGSVVSTAAGALVPHLGGVVLVRPGDIRLGGARGRATTHETGQLGVGFLGALERLRLPRVARRVVLRLPGRLDERSPPATRSAVLPASPRAPRSVRNCGGGVPAPAAPEPPAAAAAPAAPAPLLIPGPVAGGGAAQSRGGFRRGGKGAGPSSRSAWVTGGGPCHSAAGSAGGPASSRSGGRPACVSWR